MIDKIVIAATQRSGSTMVCEDLSRTHMLGYPEEWFLSWRPEAGKDWAAELAAMQKKATTPNRVFAVKLMANQLLATDHCLSTFLPPAEGTHPHLMSLFSKTLWVWVRRHDTMGQAISHYLARKTEIYHVNIAQTEFKRGASVHIDNFETKTAGEAPYDFQEVNREWHVLKQHDLVWEQFFRLNRIAPLVIWYEDAAKSPVGSLVADAVGVELIHEDPGRAYGKIPSGRNEIIRERFIHDLFSRT